MAADETERCFRLTDSPQFADSIFYLVLGPQKLPSELLRDFKNEGLIVVENCVPPGSIDDLRNAIKNGRARLESTLVVGKTMAHPVLTGLRSQVLAPDCKFAHDLVVSERSEPKAFDKWHTDWPYHGQAKFNEPLQGLQEIVCGHSFRDDNGATQYVPRSHLKGYGVPKHWNNDAKKMIKDPKHNIKRMRAPAGAVLMFDARLWHRRCPETVLRNQDRHSILMSFIVPKRSRMGNVDKVRSKFRDSKVSLPGRDRKALLQLLR